MDTEFSHISDGQDIIGKNEEDGTENLQYLAKFFYKDPIGETIRRRIRSFKIGRYYYTLVRDAVDSHYVSGNADLYDVLFKSFKPPETAVGSYTDTVNGFSIDLPQGWSAVIPYEDSDDSYVMDIHSPVDSPSIFMYMVQDSLQGDTSVEEHATTMATDFSTLPGYRQISEGAVDLGADTERYEYIFTNTAKGSRVRRRVVSIVRGTQALALVTYALDSDYRKEQSEINQIYNSLTLK